MTYDVLSPGVARLWDIEPDWSQSFSVTRSFKTRIATSRDNTEQRSALRASPRLSISYRSTLQKADLTAANRFLRAWQNKPVVVPDYVRWARTTASSAATTSTLTISPMPVWVAPGQRLVLCGATRETITILSIAGTVATLTAPLNATWAAGSVLRPMFFGSLDGKVSTSRLTKEGAEIDTSVFVYPGGESPRATGTASLYQATTYTEWRYLVVPQSDTLDRSAPDFDDSSWSVGMIPFGSATHDAAYGSRPSQTIFSSGDNAWLRKTVSRQARGIFFRVDDEAQVWYNGTQLPIVQAPPGLPFYSAAYLPASSTDDNSLVVFVRDTIFIYVYFLNVFPAREVFNWQPDYASPPSLANLWPVEPVDYGVGRTAQFRPVDLPQTLIEAEFNGLSPSKVAAIEQFFERMKGRRESFYFPSWENDLPLASTAASGTSTFLTTGTSIADEFGAFNYEDLEQCISVCMTDGTDIYRRVMGIEASAGNTQISIDTPWPTTLTTSNVARISWMPVVRFGSDDMTTVWKTPLSANVRLSFQSVAE